MSSSLKAGVGRSDVTPALGTRLGGYGTKDRPAESVHDPLHSTALVLERPPAKAAVISLDWLMIDEEDTETIRRGVHERTGIDPHAVTVCAIQTHTAPCTHTSWGWGGKEARYVAEALGKIIDSVAAADEALQPARVGIATTDSQVGVNRRGILKDSNTAFIADPHGQYDPTMTVLRFESDGGPIATLVHYGAHNTAMGQLRVVSRDWAGVMIDRVEQLTGAPVMFVNGAVGDVGPRVNFLRNGDFSAGVGDGPLAAMEVGFRAATDAMRAHQSIKEFRGDLPLQTVSREIELPHAPLPEVSEARRQLADAEATKDQWGAPMRDYMYWRAVLDAHDKPPRSTRTFHQTITRVGPVVLVPFPGEPFAGIVLRVRRFSPFAYTLCASTTNGSLGYFVTREARHRGGYEVQSSRGNGPYLLAENIDDVLVTENLNLLDELAGHEKSGVFR